MDSFQAKIGRRRPRKTENKSYRSVSFLFDTKQKIKKKNSKKIKKIPLWVHVKPKSVGKWWEREKIKIIISFRSYPTHNRNFQRIVKKFRKLKNTIMASFRSKIGWKRPRKTENKNQRSVSFLPGAK